MAERSSPPSPGAKAAPPAQAAPITDSEFPKEFGPYLLLDKLGQGGMGAIYFAWNGDANGQHCVIKKIRAALDDDESFAAGRFLDEARISIGLKHKNICAVFDVGSVEKSSYMAMEYLGRNTLRDLHDAARAKQHAISPALATWMVCEVLEGLEHAHRARGADGKALGIVHRDVSPQNVMVTLEGQVKLIDFGLAYSENKSEKTETGATMGKVQYMAPEQVRSLRPDHRADQFAAAILLYELITGERFYEGMQKHQIWGAAGGDFRPAKWSILQQHHPRLADLLDIALASEKEGRFESCADFGGALRKWLSGQKTVSAADLVRLQRQLWPNAEEEERAYRRLLPQVTASRAWFVAQGAAESLPPGRAADGIAGEITAEPSVTEQMPSRRKSRKGAWLGGAFLLLVLGGVFAASRSPAPENVIATPVASNRVAVPLPPIAPVAVVKAPVKTVKAPVKTVKVPVKTPVKTVKAPVEVAKLPVKTLVKTVNAPVDAAKAPVKAVKATLSQLEQLRRGFRRCSAPCASSWLGKLDGRKALPAVFQRPMAACRGKCGF